MLGRCARSMRSKVHVIWRAAHLKSEGHYSVDRFRSLSHHLHSVSITRNALALLWTPLPALVVIACADLVHLAPPQDGIGQNVTFWLRCWSISTAMIATLMLQMSMFLPGLNMTTRAIGAITLITSCTTTAILLPMASMIGFPLPFTITIVSPYTSMCLCSCTALRYGRRLLQDDTLRHQLLQYGIFLSLQYGLTLVYPVFAFVFNQANSAVLETLLACLLPLAKLFIKVAMSRALTSLPELRPALLMFNVEVFNALFIASCLQNASSVVTTLAIIALDCFYNTMTLRSVARRLDELSGIINGATSSVTAASPSQRVAQVLTGTISFVESATYLLRDEAVAKAVASTHTNKAGASPPRVHVQSIAQVVPTATAPATTAPDRGLPRASTSTVAGELDESRLTILERATLDALAPHDKVALARGVLDLLYVTEFVALTEFVEIVVPVIYAVYLSVVFALPNRVYYPQLRDSTAETNAASVRRVLAYVSLELASFLLFAWLLRRKMKLNLLRQLGFVLRRHSVFLPAKLMLWVAFILLCSIQHYGVDYSFRFQWLRRGTDAST